jgi:hypothetical protein
MIKLLQADIQQKEEEMQSLFVTIPISLNKEYRLKDRSYN